MTPTPLNNKDLKIFENLWILYPEKSGKDFLLKSPIRIRNIVKNKYDIEKAIINYIKYVKTLPIKKQIYSSGKRFFTQTYKNYLLTFEEKEKQKKENSILAEISQQQKIYDKQKYYDYIAKSEIWKTIKRLKLEVDNYKCSYCNSIHNLQIHHKTYKNLYNESLNDLITLCDKCHKKEHGII